MVGWRCYTICIQLGTTVLPLTQHKVNKDSKAKTNKVCKPN